jgi:protein-S-isoprenylcysteine O-methyltransferase Ste14
MESLRSAVSEIVRTRLNATGEVHDRAVSLWRHALAIVVLPGTVTVVVPAVLIWWTEDVQVGWGMSSGFRWLSALTGLALVALGLVLVAWTVHLFVREGRRTLAPWDPTSRLVVRGPYRHVRNPMISGVACVLLGEVVALGSAALLLWCATFVCVNAVYLPLVEEPGLRRRFDSEYDEYRTNVPRWIPRLRPWAPR